MRNTATEQILNYVQSAKNAAKSAEAVYSKRIAKVQSMASRHIDLFGGTAVSQVAEIAAETKLACDELYATYQMLVKMLDGQCRPLLAENPESRGIRTVYETIKWLNSESEISSTFSASLNGDGLGDLVGTKYFPSIDNKMIQSFWETTYHNCPTRIADELREKEEKKKAEADAKAKKDQLLESYDAKVAIWKPKYEAVRAQRWAEIDRRMQELLETTEDEENRIFTQKYSQKQSELEILKASKANAEQNLSRLGFFAFDAKAKQKTIIQKVNQAIPQVEQALVDLTQAHEAKLVEIHETVKSQKIKIIKEVYAKIHAPTKPSRPAELYQTMPATSRAVLENMIHGEVMTAKEVQSMAWELADMNTPQVSAILRKLCETNDVEKIDAGVYYFTVL